MAASIKTIGTALAWTVGLLGGLAGLYVFYIENLREEPMVLFIDSERENASMVDIADMPPEVFLAGEEARQTWSEGRPLVAHARLKMEVRFTNTTDRFVTPRDLAFFNAADERITVTGTTCLMTYPWTAVEPDGVQDLSCFSPWQVVVGPEESGSIFTQTPAIDALVEACSMAVGFDDDGIRDGLDRGLFAYGNQSHRSYNCGE
ncbi:MAG: hypothetical protein ACFB01_05805 [Cohaesibacteraceae bacterium]